MRIAIFSDPHLGFSPEPERQEDSFVAFREAVEKSMDCDAMLVPGDIFDTKEPGSEAIGKAIDILSAAKLNGNGCRIGEAVGKDMASLNHLATTGMPVIMLAGNHEKRAKGFSNPVESLERAGFAIYTHLQSIVLEKSGERVAVHGISAVPEQYFSEVVRQWGQKPLQGCYNMLLLHQIFTDFAISGKGLALETIPRGFDLYVDGDIHEPKLGSLDGRPFLVCGSLIPTQLKKESQEPKGLWKLDTSTGKIDFFPLENCRKVYYFELSSPSAEQIEGLIGEALAHSHKQKPLIRFKVMGELERENAIAEKFAGKALVSFAKESAKAEISSKGIAEHKMSVEEAGKRILGANLESMGLKRRFFEELFEVLAEGDKKRAEDFIEKADIAGFENAKKQETKRD